MTVVCVPAPATVTPTVIDPRVRRGAELLDERMPGWADRIDLDKFNLASGHCCVRGQLGDDAICDETIETWVSHGWYVREYDTREEHRAYAELEQDWRLAILSRRQAS